MEPDQVKVMVEAPVEVTLPNQISVSNPTVPANCTALVHVVTPPPEIDDTLGAAVPTWAKTASTSPTVWGDTAKVVRATPSLEVKPPTGVMIPGRGAYVNWSAGLVAEVPEEVVTFTSTVAAASAAEVAVMEVAEFTLKVVAATEPKRTALVPVKLVPVMATEVPPAVEPELGLIPVTVGTLPPVGCLQLRVPGSSVFPPTLSKT